MPRLPVVVVLRSLYNESSCIDKGRRGRSFLWGSSRLAGEGGLDLQEEIGGESRWRSDVGRLIVAR